VQSSASQEHERILAPAAVASTAAWPHGSPLSGLPPASRPWTAAPAAARADRSAAFSAECRAATAAIQTSAQPVTPEASMIIATVHTVADPA
jgi:hypothetical protein